MNHDRSTSVLAISFPFVWEWPCDRFQPMRCKWKFYPGVPGNTFVFLININKLGECSLLPISAFPPAMQAWCLEAQQTMYDFEMTSIRTKINFLRMVNQKCRKILGLWHHLEQFCHPMAALEFSLCETNPYLFKLLFVGFSVTCRLVYFRRSNCWRAEASYGSINIMKWYGIQGNFTFSIVKMSPFPLPWYLIPPNMGLFKI